jgi:putative DNA primase/helicase
VTTGNSNGWPDLTCELELVPASSVRPARLPMLWRQRIPAASLSVIAGKPGLGKSTLSLMIAAELSAKGKPVIVSNADGDDLAAVVRPRLEVAGADLELVHLVPPEDALSFPRHLDDLAVLIEGTGAKAVILDPIAAHFVPERRVHDRPTLRRLVHIARGSGCAILGIHHTTKAHTGRLAIDVIGGPSGGLAGTARAVFMYGYDPDDIDQRALACVKANGLEEPPALILSHDVVEYRAQRLYVEAGRLRVVGQSNAAAKAVLSRGATKADRDAAAAEWLTLYLARASDCKRPVRELRQSSGKAGFPWMTMQRAGVALKVEKLREGGWGAYGRWLWRLPDKHPARPENAKETAGASA